MSAVPGTSVKETLRLARALTAEFKKLPFVASTMDQIGRGEQADDTWGVNYDEVHVELKPLEGDEAEAAETQLRASLSKFPGVYFAIRRFLSERIEETISGSTADVAVKIYGDDLDLLDAKAKEVAKVLQAVKGAADVQEDSPPGSPRMVVKLKPERLRQFGFRPVDVMDAVGTAYEGTTVAQTYEGSRVFDVAVILDARVRQDLPLLARCCSPAPKGCAFRSTNWPTSMKIRAAPSSITKARAGARPSPATCVDATSNRSSPTRASRFSAKVKFPAGTYAVFGGASDALEQAQHEILLFSLIAAAGILLLLAVVFRRIRHLMLVLANLPFALVGGVLAVFATGGLLTVGAMVGFVTLFGITMRNSMMMVSHYEHLVNKEGMIWSVSTAIRGASERLVPVLMTAIVTALGLLPLAIGSGEPGREIEGPMAVVILGGLVTSTALNLLVLPHSR